jgi:hypothetical protein
LLEILLVLLPGDVGRQAVLDEHMPLFGRRHRLPGMGSSGLFLAGVDPPLAVGVGSGVDGVLERVLQGHPVGPAPFELSFGLPLADADADADAVGNQVAEHGVEGAELLELLEDEAHDLLDLLVGIEDHLPGGASHIASRDGESELAPASLGKLALVHALLYDVQLGLAHGSF